MRALLLAAVALVASAFGVQAQCVDTGYPFGLNSCLKSAELNGLLNNLPGPNPPVNTSGVGAQYGFVWLDTSVSPPTARQCKATPNCSKTYNASEWDIWHQQDIPNVLPVRVVAAPGAVTVTSSDSSGLVEIRKSIPAATAVSLYNTPSASWNVTISDGDCVAAAYPITVLPTNGALINGQSSDVLATSCATATYTFDGTQWARTSFAGLPEGVFFGSSAPVHPYNGQMWINTGTTPQSPLSLWDSAAWAPDRFVDRTRHLSFANKVASHWFVNMYPPVDGQTANTVDPWLIVGPQGESPPTAGSTTSGIQELADYIWDSNTRGLHGNGLSARIQGPGGTASNYAYIVPQVQPNFHPLRNQAIFIEGLGWQAAPSNTGCALRLNSAVESTFRSDGAQIGTNAATGTDNTCAVLVKPDADLPFENFTGITASRLKFGPLSNGIGGGISLSTLIFDMSGGSITQNSDISTDETNGNGAGGAAMAHYSVLFRGAGTVYNDPLSGDPVTSGNNANHYRLTDSHLADTAGIQNGRNTTEGAATFNNTWDVNGVYPHGTNAKGISTWAHGEKWTIRDISNAQGTVRECMVFEQNATNNVADVDCNAPGGSILNGVRFDTGAVNNTVWLTTQGTITNPVVDNSGGCNTVYLNGAEYSTCSVKITLNGNDAAVAPAANATAAYLQLTNTHNTGGSGAQIQFGHTVGNPYATFGSALTDGSNNGTGDLVWGIRAGSSGSVTERMRLTQAGTNLILAGLVGTNSGGITAPGVSLFGGSFSGTVLQNTVFTVQSSNDHGASAFGSTTYSEDNTAGATGATIRAYNTAFNNHPSSLKTTWNEYKETHVTKQAVVVQTFGNEDTIYNRGVVATLDPYTPNITGSTENYRVDCGEGTFTGTVTASSAGTTLTISAISAGGPYNGQVVTGAGIAADTELVRQLTGDPQIGTGTWETSVANTVSSETMTLATDPKGCTVGFHLMNNGANYRHGIVIGSDALDTAAGRIAPALAMGQNHSVSWYSAANTEAWRIYSTATAHMGDIKLADAGTITFAAATTTDMLIQLNPASTGQNAYFQFLSANVGKFILGKDAADKFFINDLANGNVSAFAVTSAGNTTVGESSKTLTIPSTPILTGVATGTPVASLCLDATNNVVKKTTTGACI